MVNCSPIAFNESNFLASTCLATALCVSVCCIFAHEARGMCITITQSHIHTPQQTHRAVTGHVEAKNLFSHQRQSNYNLKLPHSITLWSTFHLEFSLSKSQAASIFLSHTITLILCPLRKGAEFCYFFLRITNTR